MRICLVYDCLYPHTIGGAERWYRQLATRLAAEGHDVTYLTLRQWDRGENVDFDGVKVVTAGPRMKLYVDDGRRSTLPPLVFGAGVFLHLLRHGRSYDAVHTASFPYFSVLAAALVRPLARYRVMVDWFELWSREYWREYLGPVGGRVGWAIQWACMRVPQQAFSFSQLHARRLRELKIRGDVTVLALGVPDIEPPDPLPEAEPLVVFAGRHIPEKRVPALIPAMKLLRDRGSKLRCEIYGDGPERATVLELIESEGMGDVVSAPGFVERERVDRALTHALCMVLPSRREGYGLVVVESSANGTPSVLVSDPDNAATELVHEGENGFVAASASAADLADAIERVEVEGQALRERTVAWFRRNAERLSLDRSLDRLAEFYSRSSARS
jgi:glycosyltransferase involved in cell wall biosynthesis